MFVSIHHQIHDGTLWKAKLVAIPRPPASLHRHQFLASTDLTQTACLWEALSIEELRGYIDPSLEPASTQTYFQVHEGCAVGLPS